MKKILLVICLISVSYASPALVNTELVINGGAETGDTTGWVSTGIDAVPAVGPAAGFGSFAFTGSTGPTTQTLLQTIDVSAHSVQIDAHQIE